MRRRTAIGSLAIDTSTGGTPPEQKQSGSLSNQASALRLFEELNARGGSPPGICIKEPGRWQKLKIVSVLLCRIRKAPRLNYPRCRQTLTFCQLASQPRMVRHHGDCSIASKKRVQKSVCT